MDFLDQNKNIAKNVSGQFRYWHDEKVKNVSVLDQKTFL